MVPLPTEVLVVRPRHPRDDAFIAELARRAFAPWARSPSRVVARLVRDPAARTFVAEAGVVALGVAVVSMVSPWAGQQRTGQQRTWGPWSDPALAHLDAIAVDPSAQRRGVARALLGHAERFASRRGAVSMSLMTAIDNHPARGLFSTSGYIELIRLEGAYTSRTDAVRMYKPLDPRPTAGLGNRSHGS